MLENDPRSMAYVDYMTSLKCIKSINALSFFFSKVNKRQKWILVIELKYSAGVSFGKMWLRNSLFFQNKISRMGYVLIRGF